MTNDYARLKAMYGRSAAVWLLGGECRCSFRERMVGDGCSLCNPDLWLELLDDDQSGLPRDAE
jgi:hypothetical protein